MILNPSRCSLLASRILKSGQSIRTMATGRRVCAASSSVRYARYNLPMARAISGTPIIATSPASTRVSTPAARISSPPDPNSSNFVSGQSCARAFASDAPCLSPLASPATIIIDKTEELRLNSDWCSVRLDSIWLDAEWVLSTWLVIDDLLYHARSLLPLKALVAARSEEHTSELQ